MTCCAKGQIRFAIIAAVTTGPEMMDLELLFACSTVGSASHRAATSADRVLCGSPYRTEAAGAWEMRLSCDPRAGRSKTDASARLARTCRGAKLTSAEFPGRPGPRWPRQEMRRSSLGITLGIYQSPASWRRFRSPANDRDQDRMARASSSLMGPWWKLGNRWKPSLSSCKPRSSKSPRLAPREISCPSWDSRQRMLNKVRVTPRT